MARKRGHRKERGGSRPIPSRARSQRNIFPGDLEESTRAVPPSLSLIDVARNTERHRTQTDGPSRDSRLQFVPGGLLESNTEKRSTSSHERSGLGALISNGGTQTAQSYHQKTSLGGSTHAVRTEESRELSSDSGDDVVIFQGRIATNHRRPDPDATISTQNTLSDDPNQSGESTKLLGHHRLQGQRGERTRPKPTNYHTRQSKNMNKAKKRHVRGLDHEFYPEKDERVLDTSEDEAAIEDYIANIVAYDSNQEQATKNAHRNRKLDDSILSPSQALEGGQSLPASTLQAPSLTLLLEQGSVVEPGSESADEMASTSSSVDTIDQATRDLQVTFDHLDRRTYNTPQRKAEFVRLSQEARFTTENELSAIIPTPETLASDIAHRVVGQDHSRQANCRPTPMVSLTTNFEAHKLDATSSSVPNASFEWGYRNAFDISDRSRKSIANDPHFGMQLTDSELERSLLEAWKKDKTKKRQRKKEREEARARGLLGGHRNAAFIDTDQMHENGWDSLAEQVKAFLESSDECLTLPPMEKQKRYAVHEFANAFNLKSKSVGKGEERYPTLWRTSRTFRVTDALFERVEARLARRFTKGKEKQYRDKPIGKEPRRGKSSFAAASYKEGEVVGAAAPEIGLDNRGRAMLEKMGWSSGTALGADNNKGILLPVSHTVKNSRLGLG